MPRRSEFRRPDLTVPGLRRSHEPARNDRFHGSLRTRIQIRHPVLGDQLLSSRLAGGSSRPQLARRSADARGEKSGTTVGPRGRQTQPKAREPIRPRSIRTVDSSLLPNAVHDGSPDAVALKAVGTSWDGRCPCPGSDMRRAASDDPFEGSATDPRRAAVRLRHPGSLGREKMLRAFGGPEHEACRSFPDRVCQVETVFLRVAP